MNMYKTSGAAVVFAAFVYASSVLAGGNHSHSQHQHENQLKNETPIDIGHLGSQEKVQRTLKIVMYDNYYEPSKIAVNPGETILFQLENRGKLLHEFSLATPAMHIAHQPHMAEMLKNGSITTKRINHEKLHGGMSHDDPNSVLLEPGETAELIWTFPVGGTLEFACNLPGHYQTGMAGDVTFQ